MRVLRITPLWDWRSLDPPPTLADPEVSIGGHAAQALRVTLATAALGVEQLVLAPRARGAPDEAEVAPGATVRGVGPAGVPGVHRRNLAWLMGVLKALPGQRRRRWDVVHVHASGIFEPLLAALAVRLVLRRPLVLTLHHSSQATYVVQSRRDAVVQVVTRAAERAAVRRAAAVVTLTRRLAERLRGQGSFEVIPDCLDADLFAAAGGRSSLEGYGVPAGAPTILYVGRVSEEKGWRDLPAIAEALDGVHVVVCGEGPDLDELRALAAPRVHVAGALDAAAVAVAMASADVLVLPSRFEELGSVLIEAMAAGLPSVAYDVGGVAEAVEPGVTGVLVPAGDLQAMIAAVRSVLTDDALRERARTEGPRIARERFDQAAVGERLAGVYAAVAA